MDYDKRLKRLQMKRLKNFDGFVGHEENELDDEMENDDKTDDTVNAYTSYMTEVMSAFVFYSNPGANLDEVLPLVKNSATKIVKITKFLIEVHFMIRLDLFLFFYSVLFEIYSRIYHIIAG